MVSGNRLAGTGVSPGPGLRGNDRARLGWHGMSGVGMTVDGKPNQPMSVEVMEQIRTGHRALP